MDIYKGENNFYIGNESEPIGQLTYSIRDNIMYINHVFVVSHLRGQGIAGDLMNFALNYAKEENLDIEPICSYARSFIFREGNN